MTGTVKLDGLVPEALRPRTRKLVLEDLAVSADIGFLEAEIGAPQRLRVTVEVWLDAASFDVIDEREAAWDYDYLHRTITQFVQSRRYNLQETLARAIYDAVAARKGVTALRVATRKADIYPDCGGVGVDLASF